MRVSCKLPAAGVLTHCLWEYYKSIYVCFLEQTESPEVMPRLLLECFLLLCFCLLYKMLQVICLLATCNDMAIEAKPCMAVSAWKGEGGGEWSMYICHLCIA